ncbi:glycosyltransferase family 2 protein [Candidatus Uhrbacteria bacterium]|nr:glycosyltransferase family 2 protein [Candidatus Uhrbacteria bacterium]
MQQAKRLAIHLVTWNSSPYLPGLFASLEDQTSKDWSLIVVDNASSDDTQGWIERNSFGTVVLRNFKNQGFSRAHNQAISLSLSRWAETDLSQCYVLMCNPDIEFSPDCLERLMKFMDTNPDIAITGPKLLLARAKTETESDERQTERTNVIDSTGIVMYRSRRHADRGAGEQDQGQYDQDRDVFGISGACMLIRASVLGTLKQGSEWFDEDFFAYKEDVDFAWRTQRFGFRTQYLPEAVAWHHRRAVSRAQGFLWLKAFFARMKKPAYINSLSTRNHLWLNWKNDEWQNRIWHFPWIFLYETGKVFVGFWSAATWNAWFQAFAGLSKMRHKRSLDAQKVVCRGKNIRKWFI